MKEKLQEYALFAEVISAVAILISLIFVGFQIQDGNRETRAATYQTIISEVEASYQLRALSESLSLIYDKLERDGIDSLTSVEIIRLKDWETARIFRMQGQYASYSLGYIDEHTITQVAAVARGFLPLWAELELVYSGRLDPAFVSLIEN